MAQSAIVEMSVSVVVLITEVMKDVDATKMSEMMMMFDFIFISINIITHYL